MKKKLADDIKSIVEANVKTGSDKEKVEFLIYIVVKLGEIFEYDSLKMLGILDLIKQFVLEEKICDKEMEDAFKTLIAEKLSSMNLDSHTAG